MTALQELIKQFEEIKDSNLESSIDVGFATSLAKSLLEKEKEVMCAFAEYTRKCGYLSDQRGLMTTEELYDETFKTKEK